MVTVVTHYSFQKCIVLSCAAEQPTEDTSLVILARILHVSIRGNYLSGCVYSAVWVHCGTHLVVLVFRLSRSMDAVSAL